MRKLNSRTFHRYLSVVIGVQLLLWTTSGLIFSWNPIGKVRGEHLIREVEPVDVARFDLMSVRDIVGGLKQSDTVGNRLVRVELRSLLGKPVYGMHFVNPSTKVTSFALCNAINGQLASPISEELARQIALADFAEEAEVTAVELIEGDLSSHSEYRGKELPAWRVTLNHSSGTVIYVSAERGVVTTRRNNRWRLFDFFWMLHTMDYQGRDDFGHWLLRAFSILGLATVLSGYWLWWRTSRLRRRIKKQRVQL